MKKIAIFTEGQTELIFVRTLLKMLKAYSKLSFECFKLNAGSLAKKPYSFSCPDPQLHFMIIDVHNDETVLTAIRDREKGLIEKGFYEIVGLRDLYSEAYEKRSRGVISEPVSNELIKSHKTVIKQMNYPNKIKLYYSIMEIEAWFLAMYNLFQKINSKLTVAFINQHLKVDLQSIDPQKFFFRPSKEIVRIYSLCGFDYDKSEHCIESLCSKIDRSDFLSATTNGRCSSLSSFYRQIENYS
ncbi:MAG: hypothetical protein V1894_02870 [Chloroflexota bacterium]